MVALSYYSDNGVDRVIADMLPEFGYAVEVGASNGTLTSNAKHFEDKGWEVVCVEPNPHLAAEGRACRKRWHQVACGAASGETDFILVGTYPWAAYSGFHTSNIPASINPPDIQGQTQSVKVKVQTLDEILDEVKFPWLNLLTIDTEGHELEVLRGIDLERWHPPIIVAETWTEEFRNSINRYLEQFGYKIFALLNTDACYLRP